MDTEETGRPNPPYIPLMTLDNFIGKLKATVVPPVIDSSLTQTMSGGMAGALMSALKFLGLVDQTGKSRDSLKKLVAAYETDQWKVVLGEIVDSAYSDVITDLDLATATPSMLDDKFRKNSKAGGQVLDKAVRFYLAALEKMERPVSPHFKTRKVRTTSTRKPSRNAGGKPVIEKDDDEQEQDLPPDMQRIRLQLIGKPDVILTLPADFDASDWKFLKPILEAYIDRLISTN